MSRPLFHQLLGEPFAAIPETVKKLHDGRTKVLSGRCDVVRGPSALSRFFGFVTSLPPAGDNQPIKVTIECSQNREVCIRHFGHAKMQSTLTVRNKILFERLGPMRFRFKLDYEQSSRTIKWHLIHASALGIPLPVKWFSQITAQESERDGKYCFDVSAALPLAGLLVQYQGWLSD